MSRGESQRVKPASLEQLVALNDEIAALVRAGVPLEQGLNEFGREMPGQLGQMAMMLGERMKAGESLSDIVAGDERVFPPVWRAVVAAGLRSGRLSAALEGMSTTGRRVMELRRVMGLAMIYPLVVIALAYCLFLVLVTRLAPVTLNLYQDMQLSSSTALETLVWLGDTASWWAIWLPAGVIFCLVVWWHRSGQAVWSPRRAQRGWRCPLFPRWPTVGQALRDGRMATFGEVMALLLDHDVPLHEALPLAGDASGDARLARASREVAHRLSRGEVCAKREDIPAAFPPLLGWLIASGGQQVALSRTLRQSAEMFRQRAARSANWATVYVPIVLTVVFGGTATLLQALAIFGPICQLLLDLG